MMVFLLGDNPTDNGGDETDVTVFNAFFLTLRLYFLDGIVIN
jgi:hypothetical protein